MFQSTLSKSPILRKKSGRIKKKEKNNFSFVGNEISRPDLSPADRRRKEFYGSISLWLPDREQREVENIISCCSSSLLVSPPLPLVDETDYRRNNNIGFSSSHSLHKSYAPVKDLLSCSAYNSNGDLRDDPEAIDDQELSNNKKIETMDENKENNDTTTAEKELELISKFSTLQRPPQRRNLQARRPSTTISDIISSNYNKSIDNTKIEGSLELVKSFEMFYYLLEISSETNAENKKSDDSKSMIDANDKGDYQSAKNETASQDFVDGKISSNRSVQIEGKRRIRTEENISAPSHPIIIQTNPSIDEVINWRFSDSNKNEYLKLDETGLQVSFTGPYRLGNPPMIHTEYPIHRAKESSKKRKLTIKMTIVNGGNDDAIAVGLRVKQCQQELNNHNYIIDEYDEECRNNLYVYKYHGRNGYIYSQTETSKHFSEKIIRSQTYTTGDMITLSLNLGTRILTFSKNERKVGEVQVSKNAFAQNNLFPFISLNTPNSVVQAEFYDSNNGKVLIEDEPHGCATGFLNKIRNN